MPLLVKDSFLGIVFNIGQNKEIINNKTKNMRACLALIKIKNMAERFTLQHFQRNLSVLVFTKA